MHFSTRVFPSRVVSYGKELSRIGNTFDFPSKVAIENMFSLLAKNFISDYTNLTILCMVFGSDYHRNRLFMLSWKFELILTATYEASILWQNSSIGAFLSFYIKNNLLPVSYLMSAPKLKPQLTGASLSIKTALSYKQYKTNFPLKSIDASL